MMTVNHRSDTGGTEPRGDAVSHHSPAGRERVRANAPYTLRRRTDLGRIVRNPVASQPQRVRSRTIPRYTELDLQQEAEDRALWCYMHPRQRPSFTPSLLRELLMLCRDLPTSYGAVPSELRLRYFVGASRLPGIFNLGGDLAYFAEKVRDRDRHALQRYARDCAEVAYQMWTGFGLPIVTVALVQGDALGGGFEGALSFNVIVAERSARFGFPEILLNLFPGMGAYSFIARRLNAKRAEEMILGGRIYSAEQLHALGLIDVIAADGEGEAAVRDYIARNSVHHGVHCSLRAVRDRVLPLTLEELRDVADIWVDRALSLDDSDLRKMERLRAAQDRRLAKLV